MRKPLLLIGAALLAALGVVLLLLQEDPEASVKSGAAAGASASAAAPERDSRPSDVAPAAREAAPDLAPVAAPAEAAAAAVEQGPPESFLRALGAIHGRLVEPDGRPVPDTKIELLGAVIEDFIPELGVVFGDEPPSFKEAKGATRSDDEGLFRFERIEPRGIHILGLDLGGPRATARFVDRAPNPGQDVDLGDVVLDPYAVFTGRVVDEQKHPVAGARVRATNLPSIIFSFGVQDLKPGFSVAFQESVDDDWRVAPIPAWATRLIDRFPVPETHTAADGTFRLEGVPLGMATTLVDAADFVSLAHGPTPTGAGGEKDLGDLELDDGETLVGKVVDAADQPIAGAEVMAGPTFDIAPVGLLIPIGRTDAKGEFRKKGLKDVDCVVAARAEDGVDWALVKDVVPGYDEPVIRIADTFAVTVIARDGNGEIVPRPQVAIQPIHRLPLHPLLVSPVPLAKRLSYRDDGAAVVTGLDPGKYSVLAKAPGFAVEKAEADLNEGPAVVELSLVRELSAQVTVVEQGTKQPVQWALVGAFDPTAEREMRRVPLVNRRTAADGGVDLPGLKPGRYTIAVFHPGYASAEVELEVPGKPLVIELEGGGTLRGVVRSGNSPPDQPRFISVQRRGTESLPRFTTTAAEDGSFELTHLEAGEYMLIVLRRFADQGIGDVVSGMESFQPERFMDVVITGNEVTEVDIDILGTGVDGPTGFLAGRILLNGRPGAGLTLQARPKGKWRGQKTTVADALGRFDFGEVSAGELTISARKRGQAGAMAFGSLAELGVTLAEGERRDIVFEIRTGRLRGRVLDDRNAKPLATSEVRLIAEDEAKDAPRGGRLTTVTGADGTFLFEDVPQGSYTVRARRNGFAEAKLPGVAVAAGSEPPAVELRLGAGVAVRGTIELPAGAERPDFIWLEFRSEADAGMRDGAQVRGETLAYQVDGLLPGRYTVSFFAGKVELAPLTIDVPSQGLEAFVLRPAIAVVKEPEQK